MKKLSTITISTTLLLTLSGCVAPASNTNANGTTPVSAGVGIGKAIFKNAVDTKCRTTMTDNQYWKTISIALPQTKQAEIQTSVCGCVSAKAVENVTPAQLVTAVVDRSTLAELVATSVTTSFNGCYGEITKSLNLSN